MKDNPKTLSKSNNCLPLVSSVVLFRSCLKVGSAVCVVSLPRIVGYESHCSTVALAALAEPSFFAVQDEAVIRLTKRKAETRNLSTLSLHRSAGV